VTTPALAHRRMQATDADLAAYKACFDANESPRDARAISWLYRDNPVGKIFVQLAVDEASNRIAAIYATMPVWVQIDGKRTLGVQSLDTLTDKDFRGAGLFKRQAQAVYAFCSEDGAAFVYGFPNGNSAHGFFNRLGWTSLDPLPFLFYLVRPAYLASRLGFSRRWLDRLDVRRRVPTERLPREDEICAVHAIDASFDALWADFSRSVRFAVIRDAAYLQWRLSKPGESYSILAYRREGVMLAWVAFTVAEKHGGRIGYVIDLIHRLDCVHEAGVLLGRALRDMSAAGADVVLAWNLESSPNHPAFRRGGFHRLPERGRPIELHVGARPLAAQNLPLGNRDNWYLSYCDSDTV
jgi:GNAT superfamily N-acetyltransferase